MPDAPVGWLSRGRQSQLAEYIAYLVNNDERAARPKRGRNTLQQALGLLARSGQRPPSDAEVSRWLDERRMEH